MRLYKGRIKKRFVKKYLGETYKKLVWGTSLKIGDKLFACDNKEKYIKKIYCEYLDNIYGKFSNKKKIVADIVIVFDDGLTCSLINCI